MTSIKQNFEKITDATYDLRFLNEKEDKDAVVKQQMFNLNKIIDDYSKISKRISELEINQSRPQASTSINFTIENNLDSEYDKAFIRYLKKGIEPDANPYYSFNSINDNNSSRDSGYKITRTMNEKINAGVYSSSVMRKIANVVEIHNSDFYELVNMPGNIKAGWSIEEMDANQHNPITKTQIPVHQLSAQPKAGQQIVDDHQDTEYWLVRELIDVFSNAEEKAFINGDGIGKPSGLMNYIEKMQVCQSESNSVISADDIAKLYYSLNGKYSQNAKFIIGHEMAYILRVLKNNNGSYLWQPSMQLGQPDTILGKEVLVSQHMPTIRATNNPSPVACIPGSVAAFFGDFQMGYTIVDRQDILVLRDPFTHKPYIKFYTTKRVGGAVNEIDAIRALRIRK